MTKILIIGAGELQVPAILQAKEMGLEVAVFDINKNAPGIKLADESYLISTIDIETAVQKAKEIKPDGVLTLASDIPLRTVATIADELKLKAVSREIAYISTNKAKMRDKFQEYKVPVPKYAKIKSKNEFDKIIREFKDQKIIVKPTDNSGSRGVTLCDTKTDLDQAYNYSMSHSRVGEIIIEEYLIGKEVSVETFALNGEVNVIAITDKITTGPPFFVEMGHTQPSIFSDKIKYDICKVAILANKALKIENGPGHVEIIVTSEGPKVVELGARLGGDYISTHLVPLSTGVNLVKACIDLALDVKPDIKIKFNRASAIRYFSCLPGKIVSILDQNEINSISGIDKLLLYKDIGDEVPIVKNSNDRIGYFIAKAENREQIDNKVNNILNKINISTQ